MIFMINPQKKLDLHGIKYEEAVNKIEHLLNTDWRKIDGEVEIITGNGQLKEYVLKRVNELGLRWRYNPLNNTGCLRIFE